MIVDKQAASPSASTRPRAIARSSDRPPGRRRPIEVVVFSKDRACQLEALLRSMARFFEYPHRITVLYTASDRDYQRGYDVLANWYACVTWKREVDFRAELLRLIDEASERMACHVMFLVDDIVFTRRFTGEPMIEQIENDEDILAVSLRLGDNIRYCHSLGIESGPPDFFDGRRWSWRDAPRGDWDYPMSLDGNIYRLSDIVEKLADIAFCNPNTLEAGMAGDPIDRPYLVCQPLPYLVNLALNLVQDVFDNRHGGIPAEALNRCFLDRFIIDIERFAGRNFRACHIEPEVALIHHCRPMTVRPQNTEHPENRASAPPLVRGRAGPDRNSVPVRRRFITARPDGDGLILKRRLARKGLQLNRTGKAIWSLCDGQTPAASIFEALERTFRNTDGSIPVDVMSTLMALEDYGLLKFRRTACKLRWIKKLKTPPRDESKHYKTREQKTVVINRKANGRTGLFGGSLMWILEALAAAPPESRFYFRAFNKSYDVPAGIQDTRSSRDGRAVAVPCWADDVIDFLLEQRTDFSLADDVLALGPDPPLSALPQDKHLTFERAHHAFVGHFRWRPFVTDMVDDFCARERVSATDTLGVHFRGTDKPGTEGTEIEPELVVEAILDCLARRDHEFRFRAVFLATDEQPFVDMLQGRLCGAFGGADAPAFRFCALDDPTRVDDGARLSIHNRKSSIPSRDCLLYAAVNMLVLSRCAFVLKSPSALSCFAKIMQPALPLRLVNRFTADWFPDAAVPFYRASRADLDLRLAIVQGRGVV